MKSTYLVAALCALILAGCGQQQPAPVQRTVTTAAPAPSQPPVPPQATDARLQK